MSKPNLASGVGEGLFVVCLSEREGGRNFSYWAGERPYTYQIHELRQPMDTTNSVQPSSMVEQPEEDEWDADGFEIPCLKLEKPGTAEKDAAETEDSKSSPQQVRGKEEKIYLGPHGAPPSLVKQQELHAAGRRQRFRQKLKEADEKSTSIGHENKVEALRDLIGNKGSAMAPRGSPREWLDPHCHETQFERSA